MFIVTPYSTRARSDVVDSAWQGRVQNFSLGGKTIGPKVESGVGVLGEGAATHSPPARGSGERYDRPRVFHYFQHSRWPLPTL